MEFLTQVKVHNEFKIEVKDSKTGKLKQEVWAYNIILSQMYTRLVAFSTYFVNIHFGTGTGELAASRTTLFSHLGTKAAQTHETVMAFPTSKWTRRIILNPEEFVGQTLREVGVAFGGSNNNLVTHAMLEDSEGNPISLTKRDTDLVTIYATIFIQLADFPDGALRLTNFPNNNGLLNYLFGGAAPSKTFHVGVKDWPANTNTGNFISQSVGSVAAGNWVQDVASRRVSAPVTRFGTTVGNEVIKEVGVVNLFRAIMPITGVWEGRVFTGENLGTGDGVRNGFSFNRREVRPGSAVVKIDGVTTTPTIHYGDRPGDNIILYRRVIVSPRDEQARAHMITDGLTGFDNQWQSRRSDYPLPILIDFIPDERNLTVMVGTLRIHNPTANATGIRDFTLQGASDLSGPWINIFSGAMATQSETRTFTFTPVSYRYYRLRVTTLFWQGNTGSPDVVGIAEVALLALMPDNIIFSTPPAPGAAITADYAVDHIPKSSDFVLDLGFTIQFG